jgi:hypothetical protein
VTEDGRTDGRWARCRNRASQALCLLLVAGPALSQQIAPPAVEPRPALSGDPVAGALRGPDAAALPLYRRPWIRPLASLVLPGSGQLLGGQERGLAYLATEVWLVARALSLAQQGRRERSAFQELAYAVARRPFSSVRQDGPFEYYESMGHFVASGDYDSDPGAGFVPEPDTTTFNGSVWLLARRTFLENPDSLPDPASPAYSAAIAFYTSRAVSGAFRWSWRDARLEQDVFGAAIVASDEAFRSATNYLGVVVLNHIGSAVDALITQRLRRGGVPGVVPRLGIDSSVGRVTLSWHAGF